MLIKNEQVNVDDAIKFANYDNILLKRRKNNMLLSNYQISILNMNGFNYLKYNNIHDLLFDINEELNNNYDEDLDIVSSQIAEYLYYKETKK